MFSAYSCVMCLAPLIAEVFAHPDIEQAFEWGEGVVGSFIGGAGCGDFLGCYIGEFADFAHEFGGVEQVGKLAAPEAKY